MVVMTFQPILKGAAQARIVFLKEQYNEAKLHKDVEGMAYWDGVIRGINEMLNLALKEVGDDIPSYYKYV